MAKLFPDAGWLRVRAVLRESMLWMTAVKRWNRAHGLCVRRLERVVQ
jgi:hypothetical protein